MKLTAKGIVFLSLLLLSLRLPAQSLYPVSFDEKIEKSPLIVEGKVIQQSCFWNEQRTMIYTANTIEIYKFFKGRVQDQVIEVITEGGTIDGTTIQATDLLSLRKEQTGLFFLFPNTVGIRSPKSKKVLYDVYSGKQGFLKYNLKTKEANAPFAKYKNIEKQLYSALSKKLNRSYESIKPAAKINNTNNTITTLAHTVSSFTPAVVHAGALLDPTNNILTINGSGFGAGAGMAAVIFDDADDGSDGDYIGIPYNDASVLSWTDGQIRIQVPTEAGTGLLSVQNEIGEVVSFSTPLTVLYSVLNSGFIFGTGVQYREPNLMNMNGSDGYTIVYSSNTSGNGIDISSRPEMVTFQRALNTWKEIAGFAVTEGGTTTVQAVSNDGINVVMFDNNNTGRLPLPAGVLGVCYSYAGTCSSTSAVLRTGFDIVIRNPGVSQGTASFTAGPCPPWASNYTEIDLESVLLHELGHAIGLGHINDGIEGTYIPILNPGKLMNYAISNGVRRNTPDYSALAGARYLIQPQGNNYGLCTSLAEMTPTTTVTETKDNCPLIFPTTAIPTGTMVNFDLAHATSNRFVDPAYNQISCNGQETSVTNNAFYAFRTNNNGGSLNLLVSDYSTSPATLSTCSANSGFASTGVKVSIYQVNSCPSGQSFPAPVACRTFAGNGTMTPINGLAANTNYLLYVDGIENTKSVFNLTFSGSVVLPLKISVFNGVVYNNYNYLSWKCEAVVNVEKLILQRSTNGADFEDIASFTGEQIEAGTYKDYKATYGNNIYRLVVINKDQSKNFSSLVNLRKSAGDQVILYPNPTSEAISIRLTNRDSYSYNLEIFNYLGQAVLEKHLNTTEVVIPVKHLPKGLYQAVISKNNEKVESYKFRIE